MDAYKSFYLVKLAVCEIHIVLHYLLDQPLQNIWLSFGSGISTVPFCLKVVLVFSSFNSASYVKRGTRNNSGHEERDNVDAGDERIIVLSPEQDVSSEILVFKEKPLLQNAYLMVSPNSGKPPSEPYATTIPGL